MNLNFLRTPDHCFDNLPGFDYPPNYLNLPGYGSLRAHYLDLGPENAEHCFLCLHGQPTWSYLYRKMIPGFLGVGGRVIAPDFFGFGRSDKPIDEDTYTFHFHRNYLCRLIETLDLKGITLVCQDWGGLIGLTLPMAYPDRFDRMIVMNTTLGLGELPSQGFAEWKAFAATQKDLNISRLMKRSTPILSKEEAKAYDQPFPDADHKAGVRQFPELAMIQPTMEGTRTSIRAASFLQREWNGPCFMAVGVKDPVLGLPVMQQLRNTIRGASPLLEIPEGGHFLPEWGERITKEALDYF